jgi:exonuclease SbcC
MPAEEREAVRKAVQRHGEELAAAKDRWRRATADATGLTPPDLPTLEAEVASAEHTLADAHEEQAASLARCEQLQHAHDTLRAIGQESHNQEERWQLLADLAGVAAGKNAHKISFQRYVLAGLFDEVLFVASERLNLMSRGRYLLRQDDSFKTGAQQGGLNLVVEDAYTGNDRPVSTLSGGESFLAALSLALGLSDVVQRYSGGIYLDALFIDEGFGSLDPEALDLAIRALTDIHTGGRLVGVISHVPELRERIPARLEVIPGPSGSRARFEM